MFAHCFNLFYIRMYKWVLQGYHVSVIKDQVWFKTNWTSSFMSSFAFFSHTYHSPLWCNVKVALQSEKTSEYYKRILAKGKCTLWMLDSIIPFVCVTHLFTIQWIYKETATGSDQAESLTPTYTFFLKYSLRYYNCY